MNMRQPVYFLRPTLWAVIGVSVFFWIGYEDRTTIAPILLGGSLALALAFQLGQLSFMGSALYPRRRIAEYLMLGMSAGALAMPIAALSILVKVSLHSHVPPDFSQADVLAVLRRTPIWAGAGALIGFAVALSRRLERES
jgi:hypothetical protein